MRETLECVKHQGHLDDFLLVQVAFLMAGVLEFGGRCCVVLIQR